MSNVEWDGWRMIFRRLWWLLRPTPPHCRICYGPEPRVGAACMECLDAAVKRHIDSGEIVRGGMVPIIRLGVTETFYGPIGTS